MKNTDGRLVLNLVSFSYVAANPQQQGLLKVVAHDLKTDWQRIGPCFGPVLVVFGFGCHWLASSPNNAWLIACQRDAHGCVRRQRCDLRAMPNRCSGIFARWHIERY